MKVLVTGGAGYIGSITVKLLQKEGHDVVVFDNLEKGHEEAISCPLITGDLRNLGEVRKVFKDQTFNAVIHFAAYTAVGPSMKDPQAYFENNISGGLNLLSAMREFGVRCLIFSSSSEVYGEAKKLPLTEKMPLRPTNPYGETKAMFEKILSWYSHAYDLGYVALRYFNAAGATLDGSMGEDHHPETHLIPNAIRGALGFAEFELTCSRVDTPDGSTIRDYAHVLDIADAHIRALDYLANNKKNDVFNVGKGRGYSVLEVIKEVRRVSGADFPVRQGTPRAGEPPAKWAANDKIKKILNWEPKYGLREVIESAWKWHKTHPQGYEP